MFTSKLFDFFQSFSTIYLQIFRHTLFLTLMFIKVYQELCFPNDLCSSIFNDLEHRPISLFITLKKNNIRKK